MIISADTFLARVGTNDERPQDRRLAHNMLIWGFRQEHRRAIAADDLEALDRLDGLYRQLEKLR